MLPKVFVEDMLTALTSVPQTEQTCSRVYSVVIILPPCLFTITMHLHFTTSLPPSVSGIWDNAMSSDESIRISTIKSAGLSAYVHRRLDRASSIDKYKAIIIGWILEKEEQ